MIITCHIVPLLLPIEILFFKAQFGNFLCHGAFPKLLWLKVVIASLSDTLTHEIICFCNSALRWVVSISQMDSIGNNMF